MEGARLNQSLVPDSFHYLRKPRVLSLVFRTLHCPLLTQAEPDPGMASASTTTDIAIIAGVIAAVAIVLICLLIVMLHYMCRHKGTYHTNEAKGTEFAESADAALQGDPALQDAGDSSRKEYFI
ncbi:glycophorin-C isoform X1 [Aotus nancymaae]|uniref:glycophorin-C isoform X1 n=1 Tax=Aotus nancymaae TaxID=37293 RepID=UPI0030FE8A2A